ncbi:hypothetical protein COCCADRAFT_105097 [Bipolaris zeicola 26-R-13]|uniref:Uncharacterized protein n=1 Tax=Cochliobolus carbonum (strain 26-R-13) TaxID=930089 RepID=W6XW28_COCC2|nr:uncharacterized protein COCCADRAFT_105097 [Bipolaris zeicola 26-R-13]EUC29973.1 hypothetical protein COCCADRAFT_105097 [Bipolaris zeicola 26-R-13]
MRFFDVVTAAFMATSAASYPVRAARNAPAPVEGLEGIMGRNAEPQKLKVDKREPQKLKANRREPRKLMVDRRKPQKLKVD